MSRQSNAGAARFRQFANAQPSGIDVSALGGDMSCWGIFTPTSGTLKVLPTTPFTGNEYETLSVSAGMTLPLQVTRIHEDTTITDFIVLWGSP